MVKELTQSMLTQKVIRRTVSLTAADGVRVVIEKSTGYSSKDEAYPKWKILVKATGSRIKDGRSTEEQCTVEWAGELEDLEDRLGELKQFAELRQGETRNERHEAFFAYPEEIEWGWVREIEQRYWFVRFRSRETEITARFDSFDQLIGFYHAIGQALAA